MGSSLRFGTLVFTVLLCGCPRPVTPPPPPQKNRQVDLTVSTGWSCNPGQTNCKQVYDNTNTAKYTCAYTGDDNGFGDITINSAEGPNVKAQIHLKGASTFSMENIKFFDDHGQLSGSVDTNKRLGTISDLNTVLQNAKYAVTVSDSNSSGSPLTFLCDPRIVNN